ncbi:putative DNA-binding protein YlxM (UPF0122 family) [Lactobacillus colini]|uniref:DNA-binding protein YlxM (UPF0122 family) n=1 Tax=Lactobacillus colini TaxID=1819254 RepID=A0ABS4MGW2_9LACO|nr:helix-turn-helix transcriptional regulator [Lactobacillus colini]MBP2058949.1 putative DNA-binding protein YlxM (UPF0122 family) [Lactobacillus colini]
MQLTQEQIIAIKKQRGLLDYSITQLANEINVDRHTLSNIIKRGQRKVNKPTFEKLNNWIIDQYTTIK